jgi:hypothetical protein
MQLIDINDIIYLNQIVEKIAKIQNAKDLKKAIIQVHDILNKNIVT